MQAGSSLTKHSKSNVLWEQVGFPTQTVATFWHQKDQRRLCNRKWMRTESQWCYGTTKLQIISWSACLSVWSTRMRSQTNNYAVKTEQLSNNDRFHWTMHSKQNKMIEINTCDLPTTMQNAFLNENRSRCMAKWKTTQIWQLMHFQRGTALRMTQA